MCKITEKLKERFCKDLNLPIKIFKEPYFTDRMCLYDAQYDCIKKYKDFIELVEECGGEQQYFELYNKVKDAAINYLHNDYMMKFSQEEDFNKFSITNKGFPKNSIYHSGNDEKVFVSFDMVKGNFSALHNYDKRIVGSCDTYEQFLGLFTDKSHLINSKYIRQVIFGNINPKRQVTYEQYLMDKVLDKVLKSFEKDNIVFFSTDEIVVEIDKKDINKINEIAKEIVKDSKSKDINIRHEIFQLHKIYGTDGYVKEFLCDKKGIDIKGINNIEMPFVLRKLQKESVSDTDKVFVFEGKLAKLIDVPEIEINLENKDKTNLEYDFEL